MATLKTSNTVGKYIDETARETLIDYILRPDKARKYFGGIHVYAQDPAGSMDQVAEHYGKTEGVQLRHFILSFDPAEVSQPAVANEIAKRVAGYMGREFQTVFAVHEDEPHLHCHFIMNPISWLDGHRYRGKKQEFYGLFNETKHILRNYGVHRLQYVSLKE